MFVKSILFMKVLVYGSNGWIGKQFIKLQRKKIFPL